MEKLFFNREKWLALVGIMLLSIMLVVSAADTASAVNNALSFDGTNDIVDIGDVSFLDGVSQYTAEAWVRFERFSDWNTVFGKRTSDTDRALVLQCYQSSGKVGIGVGSGYGYTTSLSTYTWYHLAIVYNGGGGTLNSDRLKLYVNGTERSLSFGATVVPATTPAGSSSRLVIGAEYNLITPVSGTTGVGVPFKGQIDEFRIWSVARSATDISNNMYSQLTPASEPKLVAYYKFDEGSGTVLGDSKGSNHGALQNGPSWVTSGVTLCPGGLCATVISDTQINLAWTDNSSDEIGFKVFRDGTPIMTTAANEVSYNDTGLTCGTTYTYTVKATNALGDSSGVTASATTWGCPGVSIVSVSSITGSTVLATGNATGTGIGERGFYWWIPPTTETHFGGSESGLIPEGYGAGSFSLRLTDLRPGHTYRVKAYVKVGGQIITSDEQIFTTATTGATGKAAPTVLTDTKNFTVSGSSITVNGEITDVGSTPVNVYGFIYAPHTAPFTGDDMLKTGDRAYAMWDKTPLYQGLKFTGTIRNIPPGKWYLRAYAHNTNQDSSADQPESLSYGQEISFTVACTPETCIPGDVNGDEKISLDDAMLVLRILAGIPVGYVNLNADVNGDGKIGLEELGYILQKVAELRQ